MINFLKRLQRLEQVWQESLAGTRQTDGKSLVWFGELERKLAKLSKTTFTYRSSQRKFILKEGQAFSLSLELGQR